MDRTHAMLTAWLMFSGVAILTLFFSSRPRLFIRCFGATDDRELRRIARECLKRPDYQRVMRLIALLEFGVATVFEIVGLSMWLW
jgi:hypothetical protein